MDGLASNRHSNTAEALETSAICEIPFTRLEEPAFFSAHE